MKLVRKFHAVVACLALVVACSDRPAEQDESHEDDHGRIDRLSLSAEAFEAAGITVAPVRERVIVPAVRVTGALSYDERHMAIATARIGGRIMKVVADYGQAVTEGQVLAWIDSPELGVAQAEYRRDVSMARLRKAEYDRAQLLLQGEAISRGEMLRREADWQAAQAELQTAEQKLGILGLTRTDIERLLKDGAEAGHVYPVRAPLDGRVTEREAVSGRVVAADDELFTIAELDSLWLFLQVFEKDLPLVKEGALVSLTCESHPEERFHGTIDFVAQVLDPHSRTASARAVIDNPEGELRPGMFVYATIEGRRRDGDAPSGLAVPATAVASVEQRDVVFVQSDDGTFETRPVVVGEASSDWIEVRSGLSEGESIAVSGVFTLKSELLKGGLEEHHH
jgi:cobalt-zinc-cadmium efflux system membrane fusion protein